MGAIVRANILFLPLVLVWHFAGAPWDSLTALVAGAAMLGGVALGYPWTVWVSASDWSGMSADPLFLRINGAVSSLWGLVLLLCALAWWLGGGGVWRWLPFVVGGVLSALIPLVWVRRQLKQRLRDADPNPWESPLLAAAPARAGAPAAQGGGAGGGAGGGEGGGGAAFDVAIVGAGIGGLTAAALLARAGARVAVFEQHDKPGGFCHNWTAQAVDGGELRNFRFDGGVHDISGYFEGGTVRNLLGRLGLSDLLAWQRLDHAFIEDGVRWDVPRGWDEFARSLASRFPQDGPRLIALLDDVRVIFGSMYASAAQRGGVPGLPPSVPALMQFAREHPLAVRWMQQPFSALLDHHQISPPARRLLLGLSGYVTHDPAALTVAAQVPLLGYFLHGGFYPEGGSGALAQALADSFTLDGGELHLGCVVQSVRLAAGARGVQGVGLADGRFVAARAVVLAGDAFAAAQLLQPVAEVPPALLAQLRALRPATSMFSVHLGVRGEPPDLPPVVHLHDAGRGAMELVLPCAVDRPAAPAGYYTVELMRLVPPDRARDWFDDPAATDPRAQRDSEVYQQRKAREADAMIDLAQTVIAGLRDAIVLRREASPLTFRRYGYSTLGSVYGTLDAQGRPAPLKRRSPVPGLVFAGAAVGGAGVEPAMFTGAEAADALIPGLLAREARMPAR